jgi:hypothetical protein
MTDLSIFRLYDPAGVGPDGYPPEWHRRGPFPEVHAEQVGVKHLVREAAGHRCVRCGHPYRKGAHGRGEWSPCDERCTHAGPFRGRRDEPEFLDYPPVAERGGAVAGPLVAAGWTIEAQWRVLTVHHLNGVKWDLRWWNLVALCQRCHLSVQSRVLMERVYPFEHSEWFKPYAAGWYASAYLGEDLTRAETLARLDELLALERQA